MEREGQTKHVIGRKLQGDCEADEEGWGTTREGTGDDGGAEEGVHDARLQEAGGAEEAGRR